MPLLLKFLSSRGSRYCSCKLSGTSGCPAIWQENCNAASSAIWRIPEVPVLIASVKAGIPTPLGAATPRPVTTTLLFMWFSNDHSGNSATAYILSCCIFQRDPALQLSETEIYFFSVYRHFLSRKHGAKEFYF